MPQPGYVYNNAMNNCCFADGHVKFHQDILGWKILAVVLSSTIRRIRMITDGILSSNLIHYPLICSRVLV